MTYMATRPSGGLFNLGKKKPSPKRKPIPSKTPQAYDPLAPSFKTPQDLEGAAKAQAQASIQPLLDAIKEKDTRNQSASAARSQEIGQLYSWANDQLRNSFDTTTKALNNLIATSNAGSQQAQDTLAAALGSAADKQAALQQQLGGMGPEPQDQAILKAAAAQAAGQQGFLSSQAGALTAGAGERQRLGAVGATEASDAERRRLNALLQESEGQRQDVLGRLPDLITSARSDLQNQESQKAATRKQLSQSETQEKFQEWLATQQLGLSKNNQTFQQWLAQQQLGLDTRKQTHQEKIDWANVGINQAQANAALAEINAKAKDKKSQLRAKQWNNGAKLLNQYLQGFQDQGNVTVVTVDGKQIRVKTNDQGVPLKNPVDATTNGGYIPAGPVANPHYDDAYQLLTGEAGMSKSDALRFLARTSKFSTWRSRARRELNNLKRRGGRNVPPLSQTKSAAKSVSGMAKTIGHLLG